MKILSIETSCDDTGITIFEAKGGMNDASFRILANNLSSQIKIHQKYGGVYPMLAKREHEKNLPILLEKSLKEATRVQKNLAALPSLRGLRHGLNFSAPASPVDLIAVTSGPGLEITLWAGIVFAQQLAKVWNVPVIPVNHMEGHIVSPFGKNTGNFKIPKMKTPALALLVSGGHTELVLMKKPARLNSRSGGWMDYEIIGETLDDAVGEAFDKVARILGLPYPGGPEISRLAEEARASREQKNFAALPSRGMKNELLHFSSGSQGEIADVSLQTGDKGRHGQNFSIPALPRPMLHTKNFDFSFSGLKTAVLYLTQKIGKLNKKTKAEIALEFENAAIECLVHKTKKAIEKYKVKTLIVGGGVAANTHLRNELKKVKGVKILFPGPGLSTDNSVMIGMAGYLNFIKKKGKTGKPESIKAEGRMRL